MGLYIYLYNKCEFLLLIFSKLFKGAPSIRQRQSALILGYKARLRSVISQTNISLNELNCHIVRYGDADVIGRVTFSRLRNDVSRVIWEQSR